LNSLAFFDCLSIARRIQSQVGSVLSSELHTFAYLSCLLSLYKGNPVSEWGYDFIGIRQNAPYSQPIDDSKSNILRLGFFDIDKEQYIRVSPSGILEHDRLKLLKIYSRREQFIEGACSSILALPIGLIRNALSKEPNLLASQESNSVKALLDERSPSLVLLYDQFNALSSAVRIEMTNLMIPAIVWLSYLSKINEEKEGGMSNG